MVRRSPPNQLYIPALANTSPQGIYEPGCIRYWFGRNVVLRLVKAYSSLFTYLNSFSTRDCRPIPSRCIINLIKEGFAIFVNETIVVGIRSEEGRVGKV